MGRFCVWSQAALEALDTIYGESGKRIPAAPMVNADLARIINSDEIQSVLNAPKEGQTLYAPKANPLRSIEALEKLDPYAAEKRRAAAEESRNREKNKAAILAKRRDTRKARKAHKKQKKECYEKASKQGEVCENGFALS